MDEIVILFISPTFASSFIIITLLANLADVAVWTDGL